MHALLQMKVIRGGKVDRWREECAAKVASAVTPAAARHIADLQAHLDEGRTLSPEEWAAYQHRLARYARSGEPMGQPDLPLGPSAA